MEQLGPFLGGALVVLFLGFVAYKVKESRNKKASSGGSGGGGGTTKPPVHRK